MSNQIGRLAAEIDAVIRPNLLAAEPLAPEIRERLADLLWQLGEAAGEADEEAAKEAAEEAAEEAARPAPVTKEDLEELSRQLEWLSQEQSATRRKVAELTALTEALHRSDKARTGGHVRSFFTGFGLATALTPALACGCYFLFGLVRKMAGGAEVPFLLLLSVLVCVVWGAALFLGAGAISGKLQLWLEKLAEIEEFEKED